MNITSVLEDLNHYDKLIRQAAYTTLVDEGERVVPQLIDHFPEIEGSARLTVLRAFGQIGDERAVPLLLDAMQDRAPDSYFMTPSFAAKALGQIGGERAVDGLRRHLNNGQGTVRRMAVMVLGHIGSDPAIDVLSEALTDPDEKVRQQAVKALNAIATPRAWAVLYANGYQQ